jgi:hypothetical protein
MMRASLCFNFLKWINSMIKMGGKCDNKEGDIIENIRSLGFHVIREGATLRRVILQRVRVY